MNVTGQLLNSLRMSQSEESYSSHESFRNRRDGSDIICILHGPQDDICIHGARGRQRRNDAVDKPRNGGHDCELWLDHRDGATGLRDIHICSRYLNFYKQTMDLLTMNSIISPQEATLPIVSAAISHLWQTLSEEKKANLLQVWEQQNSSFSDLTQACLELACVEGSVKDSGVDSQGASCSLESTPEEVSRPVGRSFALTFLMPLSR